MSKSKNIVFSVAVFVLNLGLVILPYWLMLRAYGKGPLPLWLNLLGWTAVTVSLTAVVTGIVFFGRDRRKRDFSAKEMTGRIEREQLTMQADLAAYEKSMSRLRLLGALLPGLLLVCLYFTGAFLLFFPVGSYAVLLTFFLSYCVLRGCLYPRPRAQFNGVMNPAQYPEMYALIRACAARVGYRGEVRVLLGGDWSAGVYHGKGCPHLQISVQVMRLLNREELACVVCHELAHVVNRDLKQSERFNRTAELWMQLLTRQGWLGYPAGMILSPFALRYLTKQQLYNQLTCIGRECLADEFALRYSDPQQFTNALAKLCCFEYYRQECEDDFTLLCEQKPRDFYEQLIADFLNAYANRRELWRANCLRELTIKYPTHPSFAERMRAAGCTDFTVDFGIDGYDKSEVALALAEADGLWADYFDDWNLIYRENVLEPRALIDAFERKRESGALVDNVELGDAALAYRRLGQREVCVRLCDELLGRDPHNALALFQKGSYLLDNYDDAGIALVRAAMEKNDNYVEAGSECISAYLLKMGYGQLRDQFREFMHRKMEEHVNLADKMNVVKPTDNLSQSKLPQELVQELTARFAAQETVDQIFLADKFVEGEEVRSVFVVTFMPGAPQERCQEAYRAIFRCLDDRSEQFVLTAQPRNSALCRTFALKGQLLFDRQSTLNPS